MTDDVLAEQAVADSEDHPSATFEFARSRIYWFWSTLAVILIPATYIILVTTVERGIPVLSRVERNLPQILLLCAGLAALAPRWVPRSWNAAKNRLVAWQCAGPLILAACLAVSITPALLSWFDTRWGYSKIAGVIPWSDAKDYHIGAWKLLEKGALDAFTMRRPMNSGFYATRLAITGGNFWYSMMLQGFAAGAAAWLLLRTVMNRLGGAAVFAMAAVLYGFIRPFLDETLSESLGFTVGCVALAAIWQGVATSRAWLFSLGLFMLSIALNVRAGLYFVLPALLIWLLMDNARGCRVAWRPVLIGFVAVIGGFVMSFTLNAQFGTGGGPANSNFAFTLYGLAHGGTGWTSYQVEFADQHFDDSNELASAVYKAAFREIREHPLNLIRGLKKGYRTYFDQGIYGFLPGPLASIVFAAMTVGWFRLLPRGPDRRLGTMLFAVWIGMLLSVPFVFEDGGYRVMAATIPMLALVPAAGVSLLATSNWQRVSSETEAVRATVALGDPIEEVERRESRARRIVPISCAVTALVLGVAPTVVVALHDSAPQVGVDCDNGEIPVVARIGRPTPHVTIVSPGESPHNAGEMTLDEFRSDPTWSGIEIGPAFAELQSGSVMVGAYNTLDEGMESVLVIAPADALPRDLEIVSFCGRPFLDPTAAAYGMMTTEQFKVIEP